MKLLAVLLFAVFSGSVCAQDPALTRNASAEEIRGNWALMPLPPSLEPQGESNPWPSECQFFGFGESGQLKSVDTLHGPCEPMTSAQADQVFTAVKPTVTWRYDMSPVYHKAVIVVTRTDVAHYMEVWGPEIVMTAFTKDGVEFKQGDLLLSLASLKEHRIIWIRHLRRLH